MSIYRDTRRGPANDVRCFPEPAQPAPIPVRPSDGNFASQRKAQPCEMLLRTTSLWFDRLPREIQPVALCDRFPRIANAMAQSWSHPESARLYFDDLLLDRRPGRQGFPQDVLRELFTLAAEYEIRNPVAQQDIWQDAC